MERTGTYSSWVNGKIERHNQTIEGMIRVGTVDHGLGEQLWCCKAEDKAHKNHTIIHSAHKETFNFLWYESCPALLDFNIFG